MRVIALLSGGKDSVAAVAVARQMGWDVVAGLRMVPKEDDAYMFHTPNLHVVEAIAECLGMPLVTAAARSDPVEEVSDLEHALARAKEAFQLDGIISGALASEYQRTRIDAIGHRIGLRTFAPLWHKDPVQYMSWLVETHEMAFSRVAADGLDENWAGARLDEVALGRLQGMRMHPAGEGGEYESLVLNAPGFTKRIVVDQARVEASASRATWYVEQFHLESRLVPGAL